MESLHHCLGYSRYLQVGPEVPLVGDLGIRQSVLEVSRVKVEKARQVVSLTFRMTLEV